MPNKIYSDVADYLVEGSKDKGYMKCGNKGFGDGKTSTANSDYSRGYMSPESFFEGKKGSKGVSPNIQ